MNGTWTIGFPVLILGCSIAYLVWEDHKDWVARWMARMSEEIRKQTENPGRFD